jgi:hypothetical protein
MHDPDDVTHLSREDLEAEGGTALPPKEVLSLLDVNLDLDLALDLAAPIDLAVAANANIAAPIDAAVSGNILSAFSSAASMADQDVSIQQTLSGEAIADAPQTSVIDQSADAGEAADTTAIELPTDPTDALNAGLLDLNVDLALDADIAAPIAGAVALNANVAAPIDAAVAANIGSISSEAVAVADQDAVIVQTLDDVVAEATADQDSTITQ